MADIELASRLAGGMLGLLVDEPSVMIVEPGLGDFRDEPNEAARTVVGYELDAEPDRRPVAELDREDRKSRDPTLAGSIPRAAGRDWPDNHEGIPTDIGLRR